MKRNYLIFVPEKGVDENALGYSGVTEWDYKNLLHSNILVLTLEDVYLLQYESEVLNIINEENDSMLQVGEDDWVISQEIKIRIREKLLEYKNIKNNKVLEIVNSLLNIINVSIDTNKCLYFHF
jgi:hypothetical protein